MTEHEIRTAVISVPGEISGLDDLPGASPNCPECLNPMVPGVDGWDCEHGDPPHLLA